MIRGIEYAIDQVVAVLQANLGAELALIQTERADGITLDDIPAGAYFKFKNTVALDANDRAVLVYPAASRPLQFDSITSTPGRRVADDVVAVEILVKDTNNDDPARTQSRLLRYVIAAERVLPIKNVTLGATVNRCYPDGETAYTPVTQAGEDEAGQFIGSARMQFAVRQYENL